LGHFQAVSGAFHPLRTGPNSAEAGVSAVIALQTGEKHPATTVQDASKRI
jgi:hypothetical protein